jgi:hypothetical protein
MKLLLVLVVLAAAGAFIYPPYAEGTDGACSAFEHRAKALAAAELEQKSRETGGNPRLQQWLALAQGVAPAGLLADAYIRARFPDLPPAIGCTAAYWNSMQDPDLLHAVAGIRR